MFARVSVYEIPVERMDDAVQEFEAALTQISALDGFREAFFFVAPEDGRATATTFWTSRHALEASRSAASNLRTKAALAADGGVISATEYEVGVHLDRPRV
jgi:heme-degrading monooxygenase HmoA